MSRRFRAVSKSFVYVMKWISVIIITIFSVREQCYICWRQRRHKRRLWRILLYKIWHCTCDNNSTGQWNNHCKQIYIFPYCYTSTPECICTLKVLMFLLYVWSHSISYFCLCSGQIPVVVVLKRWKSISFCNTDKNSWTAVTKIVLMNPLYGLTTLSHTLFPEPYGS